MENKTIKFAKPYIFEDVEYKELDVSGLEALRVQDAADAQKELNTVTGAMLMPEYSIAFAMNVLAKATKMPIEFFQLMPARMAGQMREAVQAAMSAAVTGEEGTEFVLSAPYTFEGKSYSKVDLSGVQDMTALDVMEAENQLLAQGHATPSANTNFYYCCLMAARASRLPVEFFTMLPLCEATRIKNAMNSDRFFG